MDGVWRSADDVPRGKDGRILAHVALNGHGSYPTAGFIPRNLLAFNDYTSNQGPVWDPVSLPLCAERLTRLMHGSGTPPRDNAWDIRVTHSEETSIVGYSVQEQCLYQHILALCSGPGRDVICTTAQHWQGGKLISAGDIGWGLRRGPSARALPVRQAPLAVRGAGGWACASKSGQ